MKKTVIILLISVLTFTFFAVQPVLARSHGFWPGVAAGVGTAIILGHIFQPRVYYYDARPVRVFAPPAVETPPPPTYRERWVPGHWVEEVDRYGNYERYWVPGYWERVN